MFIGHFALGFAAKRVTPRVSLGMLFIAAQWADTLWPALVGLGVETVRIDPGNTAFTPLDFVSYPYSHSLVMLGIWGLVVGGAYRGIVGGRRTVWGLGTLVVSHWFLDWVAHRPDMPLYPGSARYGLGLWNSVPATIAVETAMYGCGLWIYMHVTRPRDAVGRWGLVALAAILMLIYVGNIVGPPPPSPDLIAIVGLAGAALFAAWAWWVDRHRDTAAA
jgi:hypothetical protein